MDAMDERIMKQIKDALAAAQQNYDQALANVNYAKGRVDALVVLLEPPKSPEPPKE